MSNVDTHTRDSRLSALKSATPEEWKNAPAVEKDGKLSILGQPVMEDWEDGYMKDLAEIATRNKGVVLELGFGMGISANYIQEHEIEKHIIVEANADVFKRLVEFAKTSPYKVEPLFGLWEEVIPTLPDSCLDGILFDTYPIEWDNSSLPPFYPFFKDAHRLLRKQGILTYYSNEAEDFSPAHLEALHTAGFTDIQKEICSVNPPEDCLYWNEKTIISPIVRKT